MCIGVDELLRVEIIDAISYLVADSMGWFRHGFGVALLC